MGKKKQKKYYAIKKGKNVENIIVESWKICEPLVNGVKGAIHESFYTKDEAERYLKGIKDEDIQSIQEKNKKARAYNQKKKSTTTSLAGIRIEKELMNSFEEKCLEFGYTKERMIEKLIKEWLI